MPATTTTVPTEAGHEEHGTRRVNGVRLYYEVRGGGAPILCVHGAGSSALLWAPAIPALARLGRVVAYDRRGYTRSERPDPCPPNSVADHADDAAALLDALGATPAVVIGRSYGGEVAIDLALRHPDRVRALVLLEGAPESLDPEAERWVRGLVDRALAAGERGPAAAAETLYRGVLGDETWVGLPEEIRRIVLENGPAVLADLRGDWLLDIEPRALAAIDKPALVVTATDSPPAFRRANEVAAAALPQARTAWVEGGHLVDPAAPAVLAFVEEVLRSG
jgi:pimeloyl-ACP methyl ester carboxylesterase